MVSHLSRCKHSRIHIRFIWEDKMNFYSYGNLGKRKQYRGLILVSYKGINMCIEIQNCSIISEIEPFEKLSWRKDRGSYLSFLGESPFKSLLFFPCKELVYLLLYAICHLCNHSKCFQLHSSWACAYACVYVCVVRQSEPEGMTKVK